MKALLSISLLSVALLGSSLVIVKSGRISERREDGKIKAEAPSFAVVELFTSEGCSSCPSAEELVEKVSKEKANLPVYILSFHVDYWNCYGWNDAFSKAAYSARQAQYVQKFGLRSAYTPQVVVSGREQFVGSDDKIMHEALNLSLTLPSKADVQVKASLVDNKVNVEYSINSMDSPSLINIALVQKSAQTIVKKGENAGKTLAHLNVVRDFFTKSAKKGKLQTITFPIPEGLSAKDMIIVAYTQNSDNLIVSGVSSCRIL